MTPPLVVRGRPAIGLLLDSYVIAEIGTNHNQSLDTARTLVHALAESGCDCAKFQIYEPDEIVSARVRAADYGFDRIYGDISAQEMFERHLVVPAGDGFYLLVFSAPFAGAKALVPQFDAVVKSFRPKF